MRELQIQPNRGVDLGHELVDGALNALSSVEPSDAHVQRLAKLLAPLVVSDLLVRSWMRPDPTHLVVGAR